MASLLKFSKSLMIGGFRKFSTNTALLKQPVVAAKQPQMEAITAGKRYSWCSCGYSKNQPFCDGSHKKTGMRPVRFVAEETREVYFCRCKQTKNPPYCDGSHMGKDVLNCTIGEAIK